MAAAARWPPVCRAVWDAPDEGSPVSQPGPPAAVARIIIANSGFLREGGPAAGAQSPDSFGVQWIVSPCIS